MKRLWIMLNVLTLLVAPLSAFANQTAVIVPQEGRSSSTVCTDITFPIDGQQANAGAGTGSAATGTGTFSLDTTNNVLSWSISYDEAQLDNGAGSQTAAHFHGPAAAGVNGGVQINISTANPAIGSATLTVTQTNQILNDLWYVNIHTTAFGGGEIRGQVDGSACTAQMQSSTDSCTDVSFPIDGQQANAGAGTGSAATGTGTFSLDTTNNLLTWSISYDEAQLDNGAGSQTAAHFHGPAAAGVNGGVQINIGTQNPTIGSATLTVTQTNQILNDLWYVNIHTTAFGGGEIRGQVDGSACAAQFDVCSTSMLINEVDADTAGVDTLEFIELYDGGAGNTSLDGCVVVLFNGNSTDNVSYDAFDLDGFSTDVNGYFVMGNPSIASADLVIDPGGSGAIQNGADAVTLYNGSDTDFPNGTLPTTTNLLSAIVYDTDDGDDAALLAALGETTQYNENELDNKDGHSIQRIQSNDPQRDPDQSYAIGTPTPDAANTAAPTAVALVGAAVDNAPISLAVMISFTLITLTIWLRRRST